MLCNDSLYVHTIGIMSLHFVGEVNLKTYAAYSFAHHSCVRKEGKLSGSYFSTIY